jgi:hypothetical protein
MIGWWAAIPWYSFKTRGRAGVWLMLGLFGLISAPVIGALATLMLMLPTRFLGL